MFELQQIINRLTNCFLPSHLQCI